MCDSYPIVFVTFLTLLWLLREDHDIRDPGHIHKTLYNTILLMFQYIYEAYYTMFPRKSGFAGRPHDRFDSLVHTQQYAIIAQSLREHLSVRCSTLWPVVSCTGR